jgi:hypothetical protein
MQLKKLYVLTVTIGLIFPPVSSAEGGLFALVDAIAKIYGINLDLKDLNQLQVDRMTTLNAALSGVHDYGRSSYNANDYTWGDSANTWQSILSLSGNGRGEGELAESIAQIAKEFPIAPDGLHSPNQIENQYYNLEAQEALASRSSADLAYKHAIRAEQTMSHLHTLIDKAVDNKSAVDLNNRLVAENTANNIE